MAHGDLRLPIV